MNTLTDNEEKTEFRFHELSDQAKEKVCEGYAESMMDDRWWDFVYQDYAERCGNSGFNNPEFAFSGFWSQGDGASFSCDFSFYGADAMKFLNSEDEGRVLKAIAEARLGMGLKVALCLSGRIETRGRYSHENTMYIEAEAPAFDLTGHEGADEALNSVAEGISYEAFDNILAAAKDIARDLYKSLGQEYEYQTSEEQVRELSEANGWRYSEDGHLI